MADAVSRQLSIDPVSRPPATSRGLSLRLAAWPNALLVAYDATMADLSDGRNKIQPRVGDIRAWIE